MHGRIVKGIGGFYYIQADRLYECKARGVFRKRSITPMIGDFVEIETDGDKGNIIEICQRKNFMIRPAVANVDLMVLVVAAQSPDPNFALIDKMLIHAEQNGIEPVVCINKTDLSNREDIKRIYESAGYRVVSVSAIDKEGLEELREIIKDKTTAFAGLSGVGKSSILNLLTDCEMETGSVSEKIHRGRHTTRHIELLMLPEGGYVMDTPGFSSMEITEIKADELQLYFPEIRSNMSGCRFRGCAHINEPDCSVKKALKSGIISESRYDSYKDLYEVLKNIKEWKH